VQSSIHVGVQKSDQTRAERARDLILDSAAAAFDRSGFSGAHMAEIIRHTGLDQGTVYLCFRSKRALADALINEKYERWEPIIKSINQTGMRGMKAVREMSRRVSFSLRDDVRVRAAMRLSQELWPLSVAKNPYATWSSIIEKYLREGIEDGELDRALDVHDAATVSVRAFFGTYVIACEIGDLEALNEQLDILWRVLMSGFGPRDSETQDDAKVRSTIRPQQQMR
jgi:AcrR family transcriptional regulator